MAPAIQYNEVFKCENILRYMQLIWNLPVTFLMNVTCLSVLSYNCVCHSITPVALFICFGVAEMMLVGLNEYHVAENYYMAGHYDRMDTTLNV